MTTNSFQTYDFYVSTDGNDRWSGKLATPNAVGTDGPFATITRARDAVRALKASGRLPGPITVWIRGGRYAIKTPIEFGPDDSAPVTYRAYPDEQPIIDAGQHVPPEAWHTEQV